MTWACIERPNFKSPQEKIFLILEDIAKENKNKYNAFMSAAVVHKKEIISIGTNQEKTHPLQERFSKNPHAVYLHAEISAIARALRVVDENFLSKCDLYVMRVKKDNKKNFVRGMAKPCEGCSQAIQHFCFKNTYYTLD